MCIYVRLCGGGKKRVLSDARYICQNFRAGVAARPPPRPRSWLRCALCSRLSQCGPCASPVSSSLYLTTYIRQHHIHHCAHVPAPAPTHSHCCARRGPRALLDMLRRKASKHARSNAQGKTKAHGTGGTRRRALLTRCPAGPSVLAPRESSKVGHKREHVCWRASDVRWLGSRRA